MKGQEPGAEAWRLHVQAGPRLRLQLPLDVEAPAGTPDGAWRLAGDGGAVAAQVWNGRLLTVLPHVPAQAERTYRLEPGESPEAVAVATAGGSVAVRIGGADFTVLRLDAAPKPFLHPLLAPGGTSVVRGWPVEPAPGDTRDHPHHRGAWVAHGDVNGMDAWEERADRLGRIVVDAVECASGAVCGHVRLALRWLDPQGGAVAAERRTYRFWGADGQARLLDQESVYAGLAGEGVRFGDTKEGALCGVRVAEGMQGAAGGRISTAEGALGEREAWGSAAGWCDYSGVPVAARAAGGAQAGEAVGVAIFDHPHNPLHPTRWHVRDYGLMAANPFALSHYLPGLGRRGDWEIPAGGAATFRFRLCVHRGEAAEAEVARRYADWAFAPRCRWVRAEA